MWFCSDVGSFAWKTCTERWPRILDVVAHDEPQCSPALRELRDEIRGGTVVLDVEEHERERWQPVTRYVGERWTALPWYLGESFLYARIRRAVRFSTTNRDPFLKQKQKEEQTFAAALSSAAPSSVEDALWLALWGNRADLSLPSAKGHTVVDERDLVIDERARAVPLVEHAKHVGILLDNAGVELAHDLRLAALLARRGQRVTLFAKDVPFFVSDATPADIDRTRRLLQLPEEGEVVASDFFSGPEFLTTSRMPPRVRDAFASCDVVVVKGDCNYRRLVGDRRPTTEAFGSIVSFPTSIVCLRTLKAEVLVGYDPARVAGLEADWLVSGRRGLVQVA